MPMPNLPKQPWMGQAQTPQRPGMPQPQMQGPSAGSARPGPKQNPAQIHAQLDAKEKQLKQELKQVQAVRTLMEAKGHAPPAGGQPQQQGARPPGR